MSGSKEFGAGEDFPQKSPSAGKPILPFDPDIPKRFIELLDTFLNYTGKGGQLLMVKLTEDGITVAEPADLDTIKDRNFVHTQVAASALWTITHNLGKYPSVRIKDSTGHSIIGDIVDISVDELTIGFTEVQTGMAILN